MLVKGGPETGKTIIALNLMAALSGEGYNVRHATGSRAFTGNLKKVLGFRAGEQFSFFNNYVSTEYDCVDPREGLPYERYDPGTRARAVFRIAN